MKQKLHYLFALALLCMTTTAWADDVSLQTDNDEAAGTAAHYYVQLVNGTNTLTIPADGSGRPTMGGQLLRSFKLYDDGGKGGSYNAGASGNYSLNKTCDLTITVPTGYRMHIKGDANVVNRNGVSHWVSFVNGTDVYEAPGFHYFDDISQGESVRFHFTSPINGELNLNSAGFDLTITVFKPGDTYSVTTAGIPNGTVPSQTGLDYNHSFSVEGTPDSYYVKGDITYTYVGNDNTTVTETTNKGYITMPNSDITITKVFKPIDYTVTYTNAVNGVDNVTNLNPTTYNVESALITLSDPTRFGYTFNGWTGEGTETPTKNLTIAAGSNGNKTYTANWTTSDETNMDVSTVGSTEQTVPNGTTLTGTGGADTHINIAAGATVTLSGLDLTNISTSNHWAGLTCLGDATIILADGTTNKVKGGHQNFPGIYVPAGSTLTIMGTGSLEAECGGSEGSGYAAGIGAGSFEIQGTTTWLDCGNIVILSGTIVAKGDLKGAGIGGAEGTSCGDITISGGNVTATGGKYVAGIGGGESNSNRPSNCGNITISGGTVIATAGSNNYEGAAGIGGGSVSASSGTTANCGGITISGGTVTATGGSGAPGIGSGKSNSQCGDIIITNDVTSITATPGTGCSNSIGTGSASSASVGTITIGGVTTTESISTTTESAIWKYTVSFDSNGGSGTMANITMMHDVAQSLPACTYTKALYVFDGWATTSDGEVIYNDMQEAINLTETQGGTVTLYAKWKASSNSFLSGSGTSEDPFKIASTITLDWLATTVNSGTNFSGTYFELTADITYTHKADNEEGADIENNYTAIGNNNHAFAGHFDGKGHTISGIRIYKGGTDNADKYQGLFGKTATGAEVINVTLADARITGYYSTGGIVGYNSGTVENCHALSTVNILDVQTNATNHGGIVGCHGGNTVRGCTSAATVIGNGEYHGGIVGYLFSESPIQDCLYLGTAVGGTNFVGAIVGVNNIHNPTKCIHINNYHIVNDLGAVNGSDIYGSRLAVVSTTKPDYFGDATTTYGTGTYTGIIAYGRLGLEYNGKYYIDNTWTGSGTSSNPYVISNTDGLDKLAADVNGGSDYQGTYFELGYDIAYTPGGNNTNNYTAIGNNNHAFAGHFDGKGHTISGIRIYKGDDRYQGIFGYISSTAEVKNIILADAYITGYENTSGIVGYNRGTIENCHVLNTVTINCALNASDRGGIVGYNHDGTVSGCISAAAITGDRTFNGGIVGYNYKGIVRDCLYLGGTVSGTSFVGAIAGYNYNNARVVNSYYTDTNIQGKDNNGNTLDNANSAVGYYENSETIINSGLVHTITLGDGITLGGTATEYGSLTAYDNFALAYNDGTSTTIYSTADNVITLNASRPGYSISTMKYNDGTEDHTITPTGDVYSFTMPASNVTVSATWTPAAVNITNGVGDVITADDEITAQTLDYARNLSAPADAASADAVVDETPVNVYTLCLPYVPATGEGIKYYTLSGSTGSTLQFTEIDGDPVANTPYLVTVSAAFSVGTTTQLTDVALKKEVTASVTAGNYIFKGTTIGLTNAEAVAEGAYILMAGNQWGQVQAATSEHPEYGSAYIPPFRAYIVSTSGARSLDNEFSDGDATGIQSLQLIDRDGSEQWFDLSGRRIEKPTKKGIYIQNGKKVIKR